MLVACLTVSIVLVTTSDIVRLANENSYEMYQNTGIANVVASLWTIWVVSIGIAIELILGPFNCLNVRYCFDSDYNDASRYLVRVII